MPVRSSRGRPLSGNAETNLARLRRERGYTQEEMARHATMSTAAYVRLERNTQPWSVNLRAVVNCAHVLAVAPTELFEPEWMERLDFGEPRAGSTER